MEESKDIIRCVARIWRLYKTQESLFRSAMGLEIPSRLRRLLGNGYMLSVLHKREVGSIYDAVKCNLSDGELSHINRSNDEFDPEHDSQCESIMRIAAEQDSLMEGYVALLSKMDQRSDAAAICREHIEKLNKLNECLAREADHLNEEEQPGTLVSVA